MPPSREPMWYCHECGAEMHPLMVPDPHCTSCNGTFVEMIEGTQDDPRAFHNMRGGDDGDFDDFTAHLRDIFPGPRPGGGRFTLSIDRSSSPGGNTFVVATPRQTDIGPDRMMPLTEFLAESGGDGGGRAMRDGLGPGGIPPQHLMVNHILGMLAQRYTDQRGQGTPNPFADILGMHRGGPEGGRFGDYVLNQQALDQIMTALMENSNAHRPVPASDEILDKLDREVLEERSLLLEKDCAVCKDQFSLRTEDPDEQVVITLPCKHPFHSTCILPWLKQNGTCPSCRYQLVPQPGSASNPNGNSGPGPGPSTGIPSFPQPTAPANPFSQSRTDTSRWSAPSRDRNRDLGGSPERNDGGGGGFISMVGNLLHSLAGGHPNSGPVPSSSGSGPDSLPGSWESSPSSRPESGTRSLHTRNQTTQSDRGAYPNAGPPTRLQPSSHDRSGSIFGPGYTGPSNRDRNGDSTTERAPRSFGRYRRGSYDRERERNRDRHGQRRDTDSWGNPDLD